MSGRGGIGRHTGLKILRLNRRAGSSPAVRTKLNLLNNSLFLSGITVASRLMDTAVLVLGWSVLLACGHRGDGISPM
jgi:hypothetical protein